MNSNALQLATYTLEGGQVLNAETVKNYLVSGNGNITDQETMMFIELCKAQKLNPFIREAYLIKFGNSPANIVVGKDVFDKLEELVNKFHRVEWRAVGGNPACRGYDNFIKRHNGNKHILKDCIRDKNGNYHDDIIYEIVKKEVTK